MRLDLEQFLAMTVALGTVGAIGVAAYTNYESRAEAAQSAPAEAEPEPEPEPFPEAPPDPPKPAKVEAAPAPAPMPALDASDEELDAAPGPQVESMNW